MQHLYWRKVRMRILPDTLGSTVAANLTEEVV